MRPVYAKGSSQEARLKGDYEDSKEVKERK